MKAALLLLSSGAEMSNPEAWADDARCVSEERLDEISELLGVPSAHLLQGLTCSQAVFDELGNLICSAVIEWLLDHVNLHLALATKEVTPAAPRKAHFATELCGRKSSVAGELCLLQVMPDDQTIPSMQHTADGLERQLMSHIHSFSCAPSDVGRKSEVGGGGRGGGEVCIDALRLLRSSNSRFVAALFERFGSGKGHTAGFKSSRGRSEAEVGDGCTERASQAILSNLVEGLRTSSTCVVCCAMREAPPNKTRKASPHSQGLGKASFPSQDWQSHLQRLGVMQLAKRLRGGFP